MLLNGQRVYDNLEYLAKPIGQYVRLCKDTNQNPIIIIDGADSGVSIDLIFYIRDFLDLIISDCKKDNITPYIIITSNNYELITEYEAIWISNLKRFNFSIKNKEDYYFFRNLYLDKK